MKPDGVSVKRNRAARVYNFLRQGPLPIADICNMVSAFGTGLEGDCRLVLHGHTRQVNVLAVLPDGKLASGSTHFVGSVIGLPPDI
jgi:hypothetical protein